MDVISMTLQGMTCLLSSIRITFSSLQCFHLIEFDGVGGQTTLVDSFKVLSDLKEKHKEAYSFLSTVPVTFQYKDNDHFLSQKRPVILLDENGELLRFNLNNDDRAASDMSPQEVTILLRFKIPYYSNTATRILQIIARSVEVIT
jgi:hypothetical protein